MELKHTTPMTKSVLVFDKNIAHAYGLQVYEKTININGGDSWLYIKNENAVPVNPTGEIPISQIDLEWNDIEQPYIPTLKERLKSLFTGKLPTMRIVRPESGRIVIAEYDKNGRTFLEVARFDYTNDGHPRWTTSVDPKGYRLVRWAYIPTHIVDFAKNSVLAKMENEMYSECIHQQRQFEYGKGNG